MSTTFEQGDQRDDSYIICPHCGHKRLAEPCDGDADEDPSERECGECEKTFTLYAYHQITYCTKAKP